MLLDVHESQVVLVDYQQRLLPAIFEREFILQNATRLAQAARLLQVPVWATEQNPGKLGGNVQALRDLCGGTVEKMEFSAAAGLMDLLRPACQPTGSNVRSLPRHLQKTPTPAERNCVVLAGIEAHVCLLQTALELLDADFDVFVVTDACSSRTERNRDAAYDRLAGAGAELVSTEMVIFEWLRTAENPLFREVQKLIK